MNKKTEKKTTISEVINEELEKRELQQAKNRAKIAGGACIGMGAIKTALILKEPVAVVVSTIATGSISLLGLAIPYPFVGLLGVGCVTGIISKYKIEKAKIKEENKKNPDMTNLFNLEDDK